MHIHRLIDCVNLGCARNMPFTCIFDSFMFGAEPLSEYIIIDIKLPDFGSA